GDDSLTAAGGTNVTLFGGDGNDTLGADAGSDVTLFGDAGNDSLTASGGTDVSLFGEDGNDTYTIDATHATLQNLLVVSLEEIRTIGTTIPLIDNQTTGVDTIQFAGLSSVTFDLNLTTQTVGGDTSVTLLGTFENVIGTPGNDKLIGNG